MYHNSTEKQDLEIKGRTGQIAYRVSAHRLPGQQYSAVLTMRVNLSTLSELPYDLKIIAIDLVKKFYGELDNEPTTENDSDLVEYNLPY